MSRTEFRDSSLLLVWITVRCHDYHQRISRLKLAAGLCLGSSVVALQFCCSVSVLVCCVTVANSSSASLCCRNDDVPYVGETAIELGTYVCVVRKERKI
jgi:hypothetical protein